MESIRAHRGMVRAGLVAGALLLTTSMMAPRTHAAGLSPMVQAVQAMFATRSFRMHITVSAGYGNSNGDAIYVRQGRTLAFYIKMSMQQKLAGTSRTEVIEMISTATHSCIRQNQHSAWKCSQAVQGLMTTTMSPQALQKASTNIKQLTTLGTKSV
ncbi:MAG TPA: hypothetical protein VHB98_23290, partial [Chloroflexota bacterium]|nr:hypothetical protein [Chloroflexota bacterium]